MTSPGTPPALEFDPFRVAVGFGVLSGAVAIVLPFLDSLTLALAAIAVAAWVWRHPPRPPGGRRSPGLGTAGGWACAGIGVAAFWALPGPWSWVRGIALGLSLVPLWWLDRHTPSALRPEARGPG